LNRKKPTWSVTAGKIPLRAGAWGAVVDYQQLVSSPPASVSGGLPLRLNPNPTRIQPGSGPLISQSVFQPSTPLARTWKGLKSGGSAIFASDPAMLPLSYTAPAPKEALHSARMESADSQPFDDELGDASHSAPLVSSSYSNTISHSVDEQ